MFLIASIKIIVLIIISIIIILLLVFYFDCQIECKSSYLKAF